MGDRVAADRLRARRTPRGRRGKVGLSGRAVAVVPDEASAARARKGAASRRACSSKSKSAPPTRLPLDDDAFDLAVVDDTARPVRRRCAPEDACATVRELLRVLRPGGRVMVIGAAPRGGLGALLTRAQSGPPFAASAKRTVALEADGLHVACARSPSARDSCSSKDEAASG